MSSESKFSGSNANRRLPSAQRAGSLTKRYRLAAVTHNLERMRLLFGIGKPRVLQAPADLIWLVQLTAIIIWRWLATAASRWSIVVGCLKYTASRHLRIHVAEEKHDEQIPALLGRIRIQVEQVRDWSLRVLRARTQETQQSDQSKIADLNRQLTGPRSQLDQLLNRRSESQLWQAAPSQSLFPS